jgi:hypothetical protein
LQRDGISSRTPAHFASLGGNMRPSLGIADL